MNAIFFILTYLLASVLSVEVEMEAYCTHWYGTTKPQCLKMLEDDADVLPNIMFLQNKREITPSICENIYLTWNKETYQEEMTMASTAPSNPGAGAGAGSGDNDFSKCPVKKYHDLRYDAWKTAIPDSVTHFRHYNIDAILNLLQYHYYKKDSNLRLVFSRQQLIDIYGEIVSPLTILEYLQAQGVCTEAEYASEVAAGRKSNPRCLRYHLTSFKRLRPADTCTLVEEVVKRPLFVQLALNPYYTQLYSFKCTNYAVDKSYYCMTYAGVLSGYDYQNVKFPHFQVWVSRHGNNNNLVRVKLSTEAVFGSITSVVYEISIDGIDTPTSAPIVPTSAPVVPTEAPIVPTSAPVVPTEAPIVPTSAPVIPTEAPIVPTEAPTSAPELPETKPTEPPGSMLCGDKGIAYYVRTKSDGSKVMDIPDDCFNHPSINVLDVSKDFPDVTHIQVGKRSFRYVRLFRANEMPNLESIELREDSFSLTNRLTGPGSNRIDQWDNKERALAEKRSFDVNKNPKLLGIMIRQGAMADYYYFNVTDHPMLQYIHIGEFTKSELPSMKSYSFHYAQHCSIAGYPNLLAIHIGGEAFRYTKEVTIWRLFKLHTLRIDSYAFAGYPGGESMVVIRHLMKMTQLVIHNALNHVYEFGASSIYTDENVPQIYQITHLDKDAMENGVYTKRALGNLAYFYNGGELKETFVDQVNAASGNPAYVME